jgi:hypothetical protein
MGGGGGGTTLKDAYGEISNAILMAAMMQAQSINNAIGIYKENFDMSLNSLKDSYAQARSDLQPYMDFGKGAATVLNQFLGIGETGNIDMTKIMTALQQTPGYQFAFQEGQRAIDSSNAAKGLLNSGAAVREMAQFGQGLASQTYEQHVSDLMNTAQLGQNTVGLTANLATNYGGNVASLYQGLGENLSNAEVAKGNALSQGLVNSVATKYKYLTG